MAAATAVAAAARTITARMKPASRKMDSIEFKIQFLSDSEPTARGDLAGDQTRKSTQSTNSLTAWR